MMDQHTGAAPAGQRGISLVELMVSLAIGLFLIGGALSVYIKSRETYSINDSLARMQETASFALKQLEPDVQLAGFWGAHNAAATIEGRAQDSAPLVVNVTNECDPNWSIRLRSAIEGSNNQRPAWNCLSDPEYQANTDILTLRRSGATPLADAQLEAGGLYVRSSALPRGQLFVGTAVPGGFPGEAQNFPIISRAYYVRPYSVGDADQPIPSLRRLDLKRVGGGLSVIDEEIVPGVEDMQLQFGIDNNGTGAVDAYVNPDNPLVLGSVVRAVRVWLLVRAERPELGYKDDIEYTLGDVIRPAANDAFRRMLVSRTIMVRN